MIEQFIESDAPYPGLIAGRAAGKTTALILKAKRYIDEHSGAAGVFIVPNIQQAELAADAFRGQGFTVSEIGRNAHYGSGIVRIRPPDSVEGYRPDFVALDNADFPGMFSAYQIARRRNRSVWLAATPKYTDKGIHWLAALYRDRKMPDAEVVANLAALGKLPDVDPDDYPDFHASTADNPYLPPRLGGAIKNIA